MKRKVLFIGLFMFLLIGATACDKDQPKPSELATPQYEVGSETAPSYAPNDGEVHTAEDGIVVVEPTLNESFSEETIFQATALPTTGLTPDNVWEQDLTATYNAFTLPDSAMLDKENGSIGVLSIPALSLRVNVYESEDEMEAMNRGAAHFKNTSAFDGNVGISAHNINLDGTNGYFIDLHTLKIGDIVTYETALGQRQYKVSLVKAISDDNWEYLGRSVENQITMITCISGKPSQRLVVKAVQK